MAVRSYPPLLLFDIDGTLVRKAGPHHRDALVEAIRRVTGIGTTTDGIALQGMLDRDIAREMMANAGVSASRISLAMPAIIREAQDIYPLTCPDLRGKVCPGVRPFLNRVARRGLRLGLVTGNLSRIGWTKVERAGLSRHFSFGAFAEEAATRSALAAKAIRLARRNRWIGPNSPIFLFGDHENDIVAAKANGIRSVAVATGISTRSDLARMGPDFLFDDLRACRIEELFART